MTQTRDEVGRVVDELEEWAAVVRMADAMSHKVPTAVAREIEATAGPVELWRLGVAMAGLSVETRATIMETLSRAILLLRSIDAPSLPTPLRAVPDAMVGARWEPPSRRQPSPSSAGS